MTGHRIGYIRISAFDQDSERQLEDIPIDRIFTDKASGKDVQREQLEELTRLVREEDTVVVYSVGRLTEQVMKGRSVL